MIPGGSGDSHGQAQYQNQPPVVNIVPPEGDPPDGGEQGGERSPEGERMQWNNPIQFFMTMLGFCVGLGNIWRFPYLCQQNGGGAFVIPFLVMLVVVGMPLLLLELGLGQKLRVGAARAW